MGAGPIVTIGGGRARGLSAAGVVAERAVAATADAGLDADALAEHQQRQGASAFTADWAALLTAIEEGSQADGIQAGWRVTQRPFEMKYFDFVGRVRRDG